MKTRYSGDGMGGKETTKLNKIRKRFTITTALLSAWALTVIIVTAGYIYIKTWTPIKAFTAKKIDGGSVIELEFNTSVPVTGYVVYGTNLEYTNKKEFSGKIQGKQQMQITYVLPEKTHYVKFVTQADDGREFETDFLAVR